MTNRERTFCCVVLALLLLAVALIAAHAAPKPPPIPPYPKRAVLSPKGAEAAAALATVTTPPAVVIPPDTNFTDYYFAATATDDAGLESDYSNEAVWRHWSSNALGSVTLAWDASPATNRITNYTVWQGVAHTNYTNSVMAATNLTATVRLAPIAPTNLLVTVRCALTNLPPLMITNPATSYYQAGASNMGGSKYLLRYQSKPAVKAPWAWVSQPAGTNSSKPAASALRVSIATNRF
jgi:hypothetical protein